jgi:signal transduction histidine kinase/ligand-binding sensor domain-containing protein/DNA-binding response OmpR family regulator
MLKKAALKIVFCCAVYLAVFAAAAAAQEQKINFTSLQTRDGLSSNTVNAILKDRYGLMWFGTEDGLNKFDGSNFTVYRYRSDDPSGLQANDIRSLYEDTAGNLWIGTSGGSMSLFDRKKNSFVHFPVSKIRGLSSAVVRSICSDYKGKIWVASLNGVDELDPVSRKVKQHLGQVNHETSFPALVFNYVFEDSRRRMWVGSDDGIYLYDRVKDTFSQIRTNTQSVPGLSENTITSITEDQSGNIWFGTKNGLNMLLANGKGFRTYKHTAGIPNTISNNIIKSLAVNKDNKLWVGTDDGLNIIDLRTGSIFISKPASRDIYSLTGKSISCIYIDNEGIYWLGPVHGGISKYNTNLNLFHLKQSNVLDQNGLNGSVVTSFAEYKNGIFVGTDGGGLNFFNTKTELVQRFNASLSDGSALNNIAIMTMEISREQQLYLGTYANGLVVMDLLSKRLQQFKQGTAAETLNSNDIFCIKQDSNGKLWIGTNGGGVNVMTPDHKVIIKYCRNPKGLNEVDYPGNNFVRFIEEDATGKMWIGTYGSGISVYNPADRSFALLNRAASNLPNDLTLSILKDHAGDIWVGSFSGGLSFYHAAKKQFVTFAEKNGLNNTTVYAITEDKQNRIWVSTNKGISSFDRKTRKFTNYTIYNGVQNNNFVLGAGISTANGVIYFGGADGFNYFNPRFFKKNKNLPSVLLTDLKISNESVLPAEEGPIREHISVAKDIDLDYKQNFTLSYVSVNYTAPEQNEYSYWLEGFDPDWIAAGTAKSVSYTNLDPGDYVFHVKARNNDGVWNAAGTSVRIHVRPPIWRTVYAYIFYALLIVGTLYYIRHRGIQKLKQDFALVQEKMKAEQLIERERQEAERLRELDQLKIKFLTNLSHEFRTPLSLIMGPVDQLINEEKESGIAGRLGMVKRNTRRLLNLVNQILDLRKIEDQELRLNRTENDIINFIKEVLESFNDLSERKQIQLVFKSQLSFYKVAFDQDKIERVLFNLLSNAFKFTPTGGKISVELEKADRQDLSGNSLLLIKVTDTGIGISSEDQEKIFERFFQAEGIAPILNQGSGIGLSIAKEFVKLHGGQIGVYSENGRGSTFTIELPFSQTEFAEELMIDFSSREVIEAPDELSQLNAEHQQALDVPSILLVEDNEDFRMYLRDALKSMYRIYEACNGQEGWQKALANHPHIIVSDINMPYMNGIDLCKKVKSDKRTHHIPVILLTAVTGEEEQLKGLETGANDYLSKPFNFEILHAKIKNLFALNNRLRDTYTKQIKVQAPEILIESHSDRLLNKVALYIEENLNNPKLSVEELSKHVGMSRGSLYHKVLELTGLSPVEYIRSVKLDKAIVLMEKSDLNVSQIAYMVGFATPNYFAKSFKARYNMQPSEYISQHRKVEENHSA